MTQTDDNPLEALALTLGIEPIKKVKWDLLTATGIEYNVGSVSGGKDSTALILKMIEDQAENMVLAHADTGHEHPLTVQYLEYLNNWLVRKGYAEIKVIKADFTAQIARRRRMMERVIAGEHKERAGSRYEWSVEIAERALEVLHPTGIPFLDMCMVHGRFPSTRVRFCSDELKKEPLIEQVQMPLLASGHDLVSWQGVRADESPSRALLPARECKQILENGAEMWNYRPILDWTVDDVFAMHARHGVDPNPLYKMGMGRVGCMPCIHAGKDEILEISKRFPEEFDRVASWEKIVQSVSKTAKATFFAVDKSGQPGTAMDDINLEDYGIWAVVKWAQTGRGGKTFDMFRMQNDGEACTSKYGLCE